MHAFVNVASHLTKLPGKAGRFDQISIALHWLTVLLVFTQFATAWSLVEGGDGARTTRLFCATACCSGCCLGRCADPAQLKKA